MRTVKIGQISFWIENGNDFGESRIRTLISTFSKINPNINFLYCDCKTEECDIVFYSLYGPIENLEDVIGNPVLVYWTDEHMCIGGNGVFKNPFDFYKNGNYSISFYDDSEDNIFYPLLLPYTEHLIRALDNKLINKKQTKDKFCTFCASNEKTYNAIFRTNAVKYISENYKQITCCGKVLNNTNGEYLSYDFKEAIDYHNRYRFNLCFENYSSSGNLNYLTEKIAKAFIYGTVPIYWGSERVEEIINPNAFINCNGLNYDEMIDKIKYVDLYEDVYQDMLHEQPFICDVHDYYNDMNKKLYNFIMNLI